jgi:hypothetical protein
VRLLILLPVIPYCPCDPLRPIGSAMQNEVVVNLSFKIKSLELTSLRESIRVTTPKALGAEILPWTSTDRNHRERWRAASDMIPRHLNNVVAQDRPGQNCGSIIGDRRKESAPNLRIDAYIRTM